MAPLFAQYEIAFVLTDKGMLYRASIADSRWQAVLQTVPLAQWAQIAYGPTEVNRRVFLLAVAQQTPGDPASMQGVLHGSRDGGMTFEALSAPGDATATSLAISPDFANDGLLFVGTADGRVVGMKP